MYIQIEDTPNPQSLKFILEKNIIEGNRTLNFNKENSDIKLKSLFDIDGVEGVFVANNFITISKGKSDDFSWDLLKPQILSVLMDFVTAGYNFFEDESRPVREFATDIEREINELIEDRVRPAVAMDGGDISFEYYDAKEGLVYVSMKGSCSGCPSSSATLKDGVKRMLSYYVPEIKDVIAI